MKRVKRDEKGLLVLGSDGNLILVDENGIEESLNPERTFAETVSLRSESADWRKKHSEVAKEYEEYRTATAEEKKKSKPESEVREVVAKEISEKYEKEISEMKSAIDTYKAKQIVASFETSKYLENTIFKGAKGMAYYIFKDRINSDGEFVDEGGNKIWSSKSPGKPADIDEALEKIIGSMPNRDSILVASVKPGADVKAQLPSSIGQTTGRGTDSGREVAMSALASKLRGTDKKTIA